MVSGEPNRMRRQGQVRGAFYDVANNPSAGETTLRTLLTLAGDGRGTVAYGREAATAIAHNQQFEPSAPRVPLCAICATALPHTRHTCSSSEASVFAASPGTLPFTRKQRPRRGPHPLTNVRFEFPCPLRGCARTRKDENAAVRGRRPSAGAAYGSALCCPGLASRARFIAIRPATLSGSLELVPGERLVVGGVGFRVGKR
jgi:hypothetical protein